MAVYDDLALCGAQITGHDIHGSGPVSYTHLDVYKRQGVLRSIPGITILSPSDITSTKGAIKAMMEYEGPCLLYTSRCV